MKRQLIFLFAGLIAFLGIDAPQHPKSARAQDETPVSEDARERIHRGVDSMLDVFNDVGAVDGEVVLPESIPVPDDLHTMFEVIEDPPIAIGDGGDRVRELQSTLNDILENRIVELGSEVYVGLPKGAERDVRIVYVPHRRSAYQIQGDWKPYLERVGEAYVEAKYTNDDDLALTRYLELPDTPLKVDGVYGQHTQAAVALFQLEHSLPVTGEVDKVTLDKLEPMAPTNLMLAGIMRWFMGPRGSEAETEDRFVNPGQRNYPFVVKTITSMIMTLFIVLASVLVLHVAGMAARSTKFVSRWLLTPSTSPWFTALRANQVFLRAAHFAPALFIYLAGMLVFPGPVAEEDEFPYLTTFQDWHDYVSHFGLAYASVVFTLVAFASASAYDDIFNPDKDVNNPISGITRVSKRFIGLVGTILVVASLAGKNPFLIAGGLGGLMALFMLVFRDYLLGLVASVQIITNRVVNVGDWIAMPKYNADGDVTEMSLTLMKVQNFDKTISTIPINAVLRESFRNWTGMQTAGGRRIKRAILIDVNSIQVCSPEMVERLERIELISDYIAGKKTELEKYNRDHNVDASSVNSRQLTNIGTFRAYLEAYLRHHPGLSDEMTFLVRHLQSTNNGLPIEIYAFCRETEWAKYEAIQADIFDHVLAILPEFHLQAFQDATNVDVLDDFLSPDVRAGLAEIEMLVAECNRELEQNPRYRLASRLRKVSVWIKDLGLEGHLAADGTDRVITLRRL